MTGNPNSKDTFYYDVSQYERRKNPKITEEEVYAKAQEHRQKPEAFYSQLYQDLNGTKIDAKTLERMSSDTGISMNINNLAPTSVNWVGNEN